MGIIFIFAKDLRMDAVSSPLCSFNVFAVYLIESLRKWKTWPGHLERETVLRCRGQTDVERNQGPHSAWTVPSCTAYHSSGPESSVQTQTFLFCGSSLNAPHLSHRILFWPWVFPSNAVPPACSFQGNVHTHPLFKISIWYTKVINLKKINTQSVQWITYSSIIF